MIVLLAMVDEHFAACVLEVGEGAGPGADVGGVESFGDGGIVDVEVSGVVGGVVDYVFEPALD